MVFDLFLLLFLFQLIRSESIDLSAYEVREHTLTRPYPSVFSTTNSYWHLVGNTIVTDQYIRLTFDDQSKAGGLWSSIPVNYPDWEMHVNFKIHGLNDRFFGDGLVIWYAKKPKLNGPVFGYANPFEGLAVIIDTYANQLIPDSRMHPYVSAMINNGTLLYDHDEDGKKTILGGCSSDLRRKSEETSILIRYQNDRLTVSLDVDGLSQWVECFSIDEVRLPTMYYFGFTAATGDLTDNHDIISIRTYRLESNERRTAEDRQFIIPEGPSPDFYYRQLYSSKSIFDGFWKLFLKFFALSLIISGCAAGLYFYTKQVRARSPRFY